MADDSLSSDKNEDKNIISPSVSIDSGQKQSSLFPAFNKEHNVPRSDAKAIEAPPMLWLSNTSFATNLLEPISRKQKNEARQESPSHESAKKANRGNERYSPSSDSSPRYSRSRSRSPSSRSRSPSQTRHSRHKHKKKKKKHKYKREENQGKGYESDKYHREEKRHKHKKKDKKRKHSPVDEKRKKSPVRLPPNRVFIEDVPQSTPAFREDRKPDRSNWDFKSLYKMHVAQYKRASDWCIGTHHNKVIVLGRDKASTYKPPPRYFAKEARKILYTDSYCPVLSQKQEKGFQDVTAKIQQPFISVSSEVSKSKQAYDANPLGIYDASTALYVQGKYPEKPSSPEKRPEQTHEEYLRAKTSTYNARLHAEPHNIALWLEFMRFQKESSEYRHLERSKEEHEKKKNADKAIWEIQAAILDKALEKNPSSVVLKLAQLELAEQEFADTEDMKQRWKNAVFTHVNHPVVWMRYLEFVRGRVISSTVSVTIKAYTKCLHKLAEIHSGNLKSHPAVPNTTHYMLEVFLELIQVLWQSNHTEKATSLLQALTELNLFCPGVLSTEGLAGQLEFLETYWDSHTARLGQPGAKGWACWLDNRGENQPTPPANNREAEEAIEDAIIQSNQDKPHTWLSMETSRQDRHWISWRPDPDQGETEEDCEDPERLVLFDDVSPALFKLESDFQKMLLVLGFLQVFDVPVPGLFPTSNPAYQRQRQFITDLRDVDCDIVKGVGEAKVGEKDSEFVENVLKQCRLAFSGNYRTLLDITLIRYLTDKFRTKAQTLDKKAKKTEAKALKKKVKELLAEEENRNNLLLWESYAIMEAGQGNVEESRKVLATALGLSQERDVRFLKLCLTLAELDMKNNRPDSALCYLVNWALSLPVVTANNKASPAQILKARNSLHNMLKQAKDDINELTEDTQVAFIVQQNELLLLTRTFALFQYLTTDIHAASVVFQQTLDRIRPKTAFPSDLNQAGAAYDTKLNMSWLQYETLTEQYIQLLQYHITARKETSVPLSMLRVPLQNALKELPCNGTLLRMYVELERKCGAGINKRRSYFFRSADTDERQGMEVWVWAIVAELHRAQDLGEHIQLATGQTSQLGIHHQVRAWLERAVSEASGRRAVLLWRLYMQFEVRMGRLSAVKGVYYRAVQRCPWAKALYLDLLRAVPSELQSVLDLMAEKEVRVRTPLEELDLLMPQDTQGEKEDTMAQQGDNPTQNEPSEEDNVT